MPNFNLTTDTWTLVASAATDAPILTKTNLVSSGPVRLQVSETLPADANNDGSVLTSDHNKLDKQTLEGGENLYAKRVDRSTAIRVETTLLVELHHPGTAVSLLGEREAMGAAALPAPGEDITRLNNLTPLPTNHKVIPIPDAAGVQMTVVAEDADDDAGGVGAREVTIEYLDSSDVAQTTTVVMGGLTPVDLSVSDVSFVNDFYVSGVGSNLISAGHIKLYLKSDSGVVYSLIAGGGNRALMPMYKVPAGKKLIEIFWNCAESQGKSSVIRLRATAKNGVLIPTIFLFAGNAYLSKNSSGPLHLPLKETMPALTVIKVSGWAKTQGADVSCSFAGLLVDE